MHDDRQKRGAVASLASLGLCKPWRQMMWTHWPSCKITTESFRKKIMLSALECQLIMQLVSIKPFDHSKTKFNSMKPP